MAYLIPRSARNVKIQLFKGLGIPEVLVVIAAILIGFVIFQIFEFAFMTGGILLFITVVTIFLVSPSIFINKKGYQVFEVLLTYYYQQKNFKRIKKGNKNGSK